MSAPTVTVRERPILFSGPMVRAILEGRKTQTRRVVKARRFDPAGRDHGGQSGWCVTWPDSGWTPELIARDFPCPYGAPLDRLWVRETWGIWHREDATPCGRPYDPEIIYRADDPDYQPSDYARAAMIAEPWRWRPSIHMPRWASRITLEITEVRVQLLQEISEEDAHAEGARRWAMVGRMDAIFGHPPRPEPHPEGTYRFGFQRLWDSINAARGYGWDVNPWVWALSFRRVA